MATTFLERIKIEEIAQISNVSLKDINWSVKV